MTKMLVNHTGRRIGKVTILSKVKNSKVTVLRTGLEYKPTLMWKARCDCGTIWEISHNRIYDNSPQSCRVCAPRSRDSHVKLPKGKHNKKSHPSYGSWYSMWRRCTSPKHVNYKRYGGRGITVCERWLSFDLFVEDMGSRPDGHTIDRINNELGYSPENCRWATSIEQRANQRPRQFKLNISKKRT